MTISIYEQSVATMRHMLKNLSTFVSKAEAHAKAKDIEPDALLQARLYPDMRNFIFQVQVATDVAKGCAARLSDTEIPSWADDEVTFADVQARIAKAIDYLSSFSPAQFEDAEERAIALTLRDKTHELSGRDYLLHFVLPNFYFHISTAYALMRHNGVELSKRDFIGSFTSED